MARSFVQTACKQSAAIALSSRWPIDWIKTALSLNKNSRDAGQQKSDFPACMLSQWKMQSWQWGWGHAAEGLDWKHSRSCLVPASWCWCRVLTSVWKATHAADLSFYYSYPGWSPAREDQRFQSLQPSSNSLHPHILHIHPKTCSQCESDYNKWMWHVWFHF